MRVVVIVWPAHLLEREYHYNVFQSEIIQIDATNNSEHHTSVYFIILESG